MKANKADFKKMFTGRGLSAFTSGHCDEMIEVVQEMYENAFLYCTPGWGKDYNCLSLSSRVDITILCRSIKKVLGVAVKYGFEHFMSEGEILIGNEDAEIIEKSFEGIFELMSKEDACSYLEEMLATSLIDRLESIEGAPGKNEKDMYYCYKEIKEVIMGYQFTDAALKGRYDSRYKEAA